ncbi:ATP-binding protein [Hyphomicrobium sp. ghe19]|uniref:HD domain-containing protein n=1 Tax=Hyphomicrobium sp. ghe19 TaxID=2682968 RepID=UPI001366A495|nr:Chaperone protein HtpG [Hyphomicrobium sp. ghe19]
MSNEIFERTSLWVKAFGDRNATHQEQRERLKTAILEMRKRTIPLVAQIHHDLPGITVHDITHLDALWEVADTIAGPSFELNPVELFVFGASVLLHDAGMALASYPGGLTSIKQTPEWKDVAAAYEKRAFGKEDSKSLEQRTLFITLRKLHANQAESLIEISHARPGTEEKLFLLEDTSLRNGYGMSIGKIAASHHWDHSRLTDALERVVGAIPGLPTEWTVDEVKVACLLRCADAAHIDSRRAPTMLYALSDPKGESARHWNFQNKLHQPTRVADKIVYSSGQPFTVSEAPSWWLCYDTLRMIDVELRNCNAILEDASSASFEAKYVSGVESPKLLARHVRVSGWSPIDAEVRVSDPVRLARTLGGKNLYGDDPVPPIRELLQNAVDAVKVRRKQEDRANLWGNVKVSIEPDASGQVWLLVDDNGVGMSERVMTGPLIDFGNSLWSSDLLQEEFPGLMSKGIDPVGKFGIGFFSVFMLGKHIKVISRKYNTGDADTRVLEFDDLSHRPLMRAAQVGELPRDFNTRIAVKLEPKAINKVSQRPSSVRDLNSYTPPMDDRLLELIAGVDVEIELSNKLTGREITHHAEWQTTNPETFLSEVLATQEENERRELIRIHAPLVRTLKDCNDHVVGRAAMLLKGRNSYRTPQPLVSVGGFCYSGVYASRLYVGSSSMSRIAGLLRGTTDDVSRATAWATVDEKTMGAWASEQGKLIDRSKFRVKDLVGFSRRILSVGGDPGELKFGYAGGTFQDFSEFRNLVRANEEIYVLLKSERFDDKFKLYPFEDLTTLYFTTPIVPNLMVLSIDSGESILDEEFMKEALEYGRQVLSEEELGDIVDEPPLSFLWRLVSEEWGPQVVVTVERINISAASLVSGEIRPWVLKFVRNKQVSISED